MKDIKYVAVAPQIIGNASNWGYSYNINDIFTPTIKGARTLGLEIFGHDDFFIAEFQDEKCIAVHIDGEHKGRYTANSKNFGVYVAGVNEELGL